MTEHSPRRDAYQRLCDRAIRILAARDHSEQELRRKLAAPTPGPQQADPASAEEIERVIDWCREHRYLDDARFISRFIASRSRKGYGPARIRQQLIQKGADRQAAEQALRDCGIDWAALAREQAARKSSATPPTTFAEKAKVQRFLLYRGYLMEDIQEIWRNFTD